MKSLLLQDKVVFLTGGSGGIGWDCARAYAAEGAKVIIAAHNREAVALAAEKLGPEHLGIVCDVTHENEVEAAIKQTLARYHRLDAVHNNAGIATPSKPVHQTSDAEWDALFNVNLKSILYTTRHAFDALAASKGCILNT